jgi:ribulose-phosphate 3-epimerase
MEVIPVINCPDAACVEEKLNILRPFYPAGGLVHLDVTDGAFSVHTTWQDSAGWTAMHPPFTLEVHLMVKRPEEFVGPWVAAGAKRLIIHVESLSRATAEALADMARAHGAELMLAANPETPIAAFEPYADLFSEFQILAVPPGPAGQELMPVVFEKISALKNMWPNVIIEVDGGINPKTAAAVKAAGADVITSGAYIFNSGDPNKAYEELKSI